MTETTPVHVSLTIIRKRRSAVSFTEVFRLVLGVLHEHRLLRGKMIGIDASTLEANAAMKTIVRKDTGDDWNEYLRKRRLSRWRSERCERTFAHVCETGAAPRRSQVGLIRIRCV